MTLTQTAAIVRQVVTVSIIALVLGTISFIGYRMWYAYYLAHLPPVEEKPDIRFGPLPPVNFPKSKVSTSNFSYSLDTTTGGLPKIGVDSGFEKITKVYFVTQTFATFLSADRSSALAANFGLVAPPEILSDTKYKYTDQNEATSLLRNKTLTVELDSGNFSYRNEATISGKVNLDNDNKLVSDFEQTLTTLGVMKDDLKTGRTKVTFLKNAGEALIPTQLRSEAVAAQISLWPSPIDKKSIFTADFDKSLVNAVVSGSADKLDYYLSLDFIYYPIDTSTFATYPIKEAEVAFEDLKSGKGVVISEPKSPQVSITSIYLGYFLSDEYSPYLQPIFIFEGPNFVAYVAAISGEFQSPAK
ncbi:MAG: hypothetical protein PHE48_01310 [Candidatus Daviesbacteria bacterium]|nr:hypothetical protein [Candidatus Daviesbacteria bacterium]